MNTLLMLLVFFVNCEESCTSKEVRKNWKYEAINRDQWDLYAVLSTEQFHVTSTEGESVHDDLIY